MSDAISALPGAHYAGMIDLAEAGPRGMITIRGDLALPALAKAVKKATGAEIPGPRRVSSGEKGAVAWMSPDELLLFVDYKAVAAVVAALEAAQAGEFVTVADVSDARAVFTLKGAQGRDVLAKLCPVDFAPDAFGPGTIRRTRAAQVAAAVWQSGDAEASLICFRSVAGYVGTLLATAAHPSGAVGLHDRPARVSGATP